MDRHVGKTDSFISLSVLTVVAEAWQPNTTLYNCELSFHLFI